MSQSTVPDFFQEDTTEALRSQVDWLTRTVGVDDSFFARLVGTDVTRFSNWRSRTGELHAPGEDTLRAFWRTVLHLLSFLSYDDRRFRELFEYAAPQRHEIGPPAPPWMGSTLRTYLERAGADAIEKIDTWVTGLRFGDPYSA